jgi:DNA-binding protein H-NS
MTPYKELLEQRDAIERQIREVRGREMQGAVEQVRALVSDFGLTLDDVFGKKRSALTGKKTQAKFRDPASGTTWSGRGKPPRWIADKDRSGFLIS